MRACVRLDACVRASHVASVGSHVVSDTHRERESARARDRQTEREREKERRMPSVPSRTESSSCALT